MLFNMLSFKQGLNLNDMVQKSELLVYLFYINHNKTNCVQKTKVNKLNSRQILYNFISSEARILAEWAQVHPKNFKNLL